MDNQISVQWDSITGVFDWVPVFPITLIDVEILDNWHTHPLVWEVERSQQHSWCILAMVHYTLVTSHKGSPIVVYGASFIYIPTHQARTSLTDALKYLKRSKEDCVILVSMPIKPTFSSQPLRGKYYTMLPINGDPDADQGPLGPFATTTLPIASREGHSDMAIHIKLLPSYGSSKRPKTELIEEPVLSRGPLWKNVHFVECNSSGDIVPGKSGQTLCQELIISLSTLGSKIDYTPTSTECALPLTVMACAPGWDDYFDLNETLAEMTQCLMDKDRQLMGSVPKESAPDQKDEDTKIVAIQPNDDPMMPRLRHQVQEHTLRAWTLEMSPKYSVTSVMPLMK